MTKSSKQCPRCKETKPFPAFHRDVAKCFGVATYCKPCAIEKARVYYGQNRQRCIETISKWKCRNAGKVFAYVRAYDLRNPDRKRAQSKLQNAVSGGTIVKPGCCEACGKEVALDGHHEDYSKSLEVKWLCRQCHVDVHATDGVLT